MARATARVGPGRRAPERLAGARRARAVRGAVQYARPGMRALGSIAAWGVGAWAAVAVAAEPGRPAALRSVVAGDADHVFGWASVTKLCSTLAVLVAVEEGTVRLEDPAGPPGSTVAHLLAHASGLAPDAPVVLAPPGRRRIYSSAGFDELGAHVGRQASMPFADYVDQAVCRPLSMSRARWVGGRSPARDLAGTVGDLARLAEELLVPRLVHPGTLRQATEVAFAGLAGMLPGFGLQDPCDWGLGFELRDAKHPHWTGSANSPATFGHFGASGCFLWVDPAEHVALGVLTDRPFGSWAADAWPALSDEVLAEARGAGDRW